MLVTLLGIVTLVNELQASNAPSPMLVTLLGIVTLVNELHPQNAKSPMLVTLQPPKVDGIESEPFVFEGIADEIKIEV